VTVPAVLVSALLLGSRCERQIRARRTFDTVGHPWVVSDVATEPHLGIGGDVYSVGWYLFPDDHGGAEFWMNKLQMKPNDYFPFRVDVEDCSQGNCSRPIAVGNVLHLFGQYRTQVAGDGNARNRQPTSS
jgi:hypothetical protein